jgi:MerR family transcriptional regulator, repressor of the yfmOP operon
MYSIRAFAALAGVTIKALRHYEKVGLLTPERTGSRYRRYSHQDMRRLERILALKSLALPLKTIKAMLAHVEVTVTTHREALQHKRARLDRAIDALTTIEAHPRPADALQRFIADAGWERWEEERRRRASTAPRPPDRVSASRLALFRKIERALADNPAGLRAQTLCAKWREVTDSETLEALTTRASWPSGMRRYVASLYDTTPETWERVVGFIEARGRS